MCLGNFLVGATEGRISQ